MSFQRPESSRHEPTGSHMPQGMGSALTGAMGRSAVVFHDDMRKLWTEHVIWTRNYIISFAADLPDKDVIAERLLRNQDDIGTAIKQFYGEDAGNNLTKLLKEHIHQAIDILVAAKSGDKGQTDAAIAKWYQNADQISAFLSGANAKNWPLNDMKKHMRMHLDTTLEEAVARLKGDWVADVRAYDKVYDVILGLADTLSSGIVAQFPAKFK